MRKLLSRNGIAIDAEDDHHKTHGKTCDPASNSVKARVAPISPRSSD